MKLGIMQPYFFPYLGYFDLIHYADRWILLDTVQYIRHGWVNRNRVLHPKQSWQYIVVPLRKHSRATLISEIVTADSDWKRRLLGQINHYRRRAPYFRDTRELVRACLSTDEQSLARINGRCLQHVCDYLGMDFQQEYLSDMRLVLGDIEDPGDWALEITRALGYSTYVNPTGGQAFLQHRKFAQHGITLELRKFRHLCYDCFGYTFEPGLSIIDVLMWNSPQTVRSFLQTRRQFVELPLP